MSATTAFIFPYRFPFCATDISAAISSQTNASHVANLTAEEVMGFAWNLETYSFSITGYVYTAGLTIDCNIDFTLKDTLNDRPSSNTFDQGAVYTCMMYGNQSAVISFTSFSEPYFPDQRIPLERMCAVTPAITGCVLDIGMDASQNSNFPNSQWAFHVGTDPANAGRYRLYYEFSVQATDGGTESTDFYCTSISSLPGLDAVTNGTFVIAGITFNFYSFKSTGATHEGGALTSSSSFYTYA